MHDDCPERGVLAKKKRPADLLLLTRRARILRGAAENRHEATE